MSALGCSLTRLKDSSCLLIMEGTHERLGCGQNGALP